MPFPCSATNPRALDSFSILDDIVRRLDWLEPQIGAEDNRWTMAWLGFTGRTWATSGWPLTAWGGGLRGKPASDGFRDFGAHAVPHTP